MKTVALAPEVDAVNVFLEQRPKSFGTRPSSGCSLCGCQGVHACTGQPITWTEDDRAKLKTALAKMFGWTIPASPEELAANTTADAREAERAQPSLSEV